MNHDQVPLTFGHCEVFYTLPLTSLISLKTIKTSVLEELPQSLRGLQQTAIHPYKVFQKVLLLL